jgi:hypothetical protein
MYRQMLKALAVISLFGMLAAPVVQAQSGMLVANIPFQFNVGKAVLPSGEYHVKAMNPTTFLIQSKDGHQAAVANTIGVSSSKEEDNGKLVFNRYGNQYFLSKVWRGGNREGRELVKSRTEIEIASISSPEATTVAVKTP